MLDELVSSVGPGPAGSASGAAARPSEGLRRVIERALQRKSEEGYSDAIAMHDDLKRAVDEE